MALRSMATSSIALCIASVAAADDAPSEVAQAVSATNPVFFQDRHKYDAEVGVK